MKTYNFSAGPAVLPSAVLERMKEELLDWHGSGISVMEMSHRSSAFEHIVTTAELDLRDLLQISNDYAVLFLQGGAHLQFAMIPMNLANLNRNADYLDAGFWSRRAIEEAKKYCDVHIVASNAKAGIYPQGTYIPPHWDIRANTDYLHITSNETVGGVELFNLPDIGNISLICDMSSHILSRPVDVSRYALIYAGAQKNIGPAGLTLIILRKDLVQNLPSHIPTMLNYRIHIDNCSLYNTPPCFGIYTAGLVFQWLKNQGGLVAMEQLNIQKAELFYHYLDNSYFYSAIVPAPYRSRMNIPFALKDPIQETKFLQEAEENGLIQLKGHKSVGGLRASLYNAMPIDGVRALINFMQKFESRYAR